MVKDNKGFMLAEVVIVSAILITTLVSLYIGFSRVYKAYEERSIFFDTNSVYALKNIKNFMIDEMLINNIILDSSFNYVSYKLEELDNNVKYFSNDYHNNYLKTIFKNNNIEYIYITKYKIDNINNIINSDSNNITLNDYLTYLIKNLNFSENYNYIFISKTKDGKFSYLRMV